MDAIKNRASMLGKYPPKIWPITGDWMGTLEGETASARTLSCTSRNKRFAGASNCSVISGKKILS